MKTSAKYFDLADRSRPGNMSQNGQKLLHLWHHSQKIRNPQPKKFFRVQTRRQITPNGGPGGLEGRVAKWKTWIFYGLASCTEGQAGRLHYRAGQWAAEMGGPEGCPFLQPALPFSAARRTAFLCSPLARPFVFCAAWQKCTFLIWKHGPPAL